MRVSHLNRTWDKRAFVMANPRTRLNRMTVTGEIFQTKSLMALSRSNRPIMAGQFGGPPALLMNPRGGHMPLSQQILHIMKRLSEIARMANEVCAYACFSLAFAVSVTPARYFLSCALW
jgi:hypothetical protein